MEVAIKGDAKEIADLVLAVQGQLTIASEDKKMRLNTGETTINHIRYESGLNKNTDEVSSQQLMKLD